MRHEIPAAILDPFLYGERDGAAFAVLSVLDEASVREVRPDVEIVDPLELGLMDLLEQGMDRDAALTEIALRACERAGLRSAVVPRRFPLGIADRLRAGGIELAVDGAQFDGRRRVKAGAELGGPPRRQAADAGMAAAAALLAQRRAGRRRDSPRRRRAAHRRARAGRRARRVRARGRGGRRGARRAGAAGRDGPRPRLRPHRRRRAGGRRPVAAGPRVALLGGHDPDVRRRRARRRRRALAQPLPRRARPRARRARAGRDGRELWEVCCDVFEAAGEPTQRDPQGQTPLRDGFFHSLGHGVGLEVHEAPGLGRSGEALVAGDVVAIEPGLYRHGYGGVRIEDLFLVTEDGSRR